MADYVFTSGTCLKQDVYSLVINTMISAGWANISTSQATDFDVLYSTGETGDKALYIQLRPSSTTAVNPVNTTDYCVASYRLINKYTPAAGGTGAGTFLRPSEVWKALYITPVAAVTTTVVKSTTITYKIHANKNRVIVVLETPSAVGLGGIVLYIGIPDKNYCTETNSTGLLVASSFGMVTANTVDLTDAIAEMPSQTASATRSVYCTLAAKNPNGSGKYMLSEMYYGNSTEGMRGKLTGLYTLPNSNILSGDVIQVGARRFYIVICQAGTTSFSSAAIAVQI